MPIPLVIDTDPGIDDALAILLAVASPEVDLRLVTTVHGNVELERTTENALRVLHLGGRSDVPVAVGARSSLVHPQRVLGRLGQLHVAVHGGDQAEVHLGAGHGEQDRERVVDAGVGVDHQGDGSGHAAILAAGPRHAARAGSPPG